MKRLSFLTRGADKVAAGFELFDAVSIGTAEMAHAASHYWIEKTAAATYQTVWGGE